MALQLTSPPITWFRLMQIYSHLGDKSNPTTEEFGDIVGSELKKLDGKHEVVIESINAKLDDLIKRSTKDSSMSKEEMATFKEDIVKGMADHASNHEHQCSVPVACSGNSVEWNDSVQQMFQSLVTKIDEVHTKLKSQETLFDNLKEGPQVNAPQNLSEGDLERITDSTAAKLEQILGRNKVEVKQGEPPVAQTEAHASADDMKTVLGKLDNLSQTSKNSHEALGTAVSRLTDYISQNNARLSTKDVDVLVSGLGQNLQENGVRLNDDAVSAVVQGILNSINSMRQSLVVEEKQKPLERPQTFNETAYRWTTDEAVQKFKEKDQNLLIQVSEAVDEIAKAEATYANQNAQAMVFNHEQKIDYDTLRTLAKERYDKCSNADHTPFSFTRLTQLVSRGNSNNANGNLMLDRFFHTIVGVMETFFEIDSQNDISLLRFLHTMMQQKGC